MIGLLEQLALLRRRPSRQGSGGNLSYLRHVVAAYMEMDDGQVEQDALFQVIATFLQFDAPTVQRLHLARRRKADAAGGLFGKWM